MVGARVHSVARGSWESRRHALELEAVRVIRDSQGVFPLVEITLRNPAPSTSFLHSTMTGTIAARSLTRSCCSSLVSAGLSR